MRVVTVVGVAIPWGAPGEPGTGGVCIQGNDEQEYVVTGGITPDEARLLYHKRIRVRGKVVRMRQGSGMEVLCYEIVPVDFRLGGKG
jgi:hypothetical protein